MDQQSQRCFVVGRHHSGFPDFLQHDTPGFVEVTGQA